jgi:hypothetical protein
MKPRACQLLAAAAPLAFSAAALPQIAVQWSDPRGDTLIRRTDETNSAPLNPSGTIPDLIGVAVVPWDTPTPTADPYNGTPVPAAGARLFRLDLVFYGVVNPPGPLFSEFDPYRFGNSPVYGFLDLDVDADIDTGGEFGDEMSSRYLANIGRFGRVPVGALHARAALHGTDVISGAFIARSGEDFSLSFCGCNAPAIVSESGNGDHIFNAGETWVVRGDFFRLSPGYRLCSFAFGGVSNIPGYYDPPVDVRFSHDLATNQTTISLVYSLNNCGSGLLAGQPPEPYNFNAGDQTSITEGLLNVIQAAQFPLSGPTQVLAGGWRSRAVTPEMLDPSRWQVTALFGTCSSSDSPAPSFIWTDTGLRDVLGDVNGDGIADTADRDLVRDEIARLDGTRDDGEGTAYENGAVLITNFGRNFNAFDITSDGWIDDRDARFYCIGDYNSDGVLNVADFFGFLGGFAGNIPRADIDHNGIFDVRDFLGFSLAYATGCP